MNRNMGIRMLEQEDLTSLCIITEQVCEVLAGRVGAEGIRCHARAQRQGDVSP